MKRNICLAVFCLCLLMLLPQSVSATFQNAYVRTLADLGELETYLTDPIDDFSGRWEFGGDVSINATRSEDQGLGMLLLRDIQYREGYMSFQYLDPVSLRNDSSVCFGVFLRSGGDGESACTITTTVTCGSNTMVGTVQLEGEGWYVIYSALPSIAKRRNVDSIQIQIEYEEAHTPEQMWITSPCASTNKCAFANRFSTEQFTATLGECKAESTQLYLTADSGSAVSLTAEFLPQQSVNSVSGWYMAVTVSGTEEGGSMAVGATYGETVCTSGTLSVQEGTNTYYFPVPTPSTAASDTALSSGSYHSAQLLPEQYSLYFQGVKSTTSSHFLVTKVTFYPKENADTWQDGNLGSVSEMVVQDGRVRISGKLTRQAVIDYSDNDIALVALPLWDRYDLTGVESSTVELSTMRVSKNFTFTLPADDVRTYASAYLFYVAIRTEVPVQDPTAEPKVVYLPVSEPQMLTGTDPMACTVSMFGLHGADTVGVFESNVSHVTVDVYWDKLLSTSGISCSFGGKSYHLSQDYLEELDNDVLFYIDAGLEVSLRILSSEPFSYSDREAETYLPLIDTEEAAAEYGAVLSYLCSRYTGVASITLGKGINQSQYMGLSLVEPVSVIRRVASLAAMTYEVARLYSPDVYIVIPFSDDHVYQQNESITDISTLSPTFAMLLFADALGEIGNIPWVASWRFESDTMPGGKTPTETAALPSRWKNILQQLGIAPFRDFLYRWEPETCIAGEKVPYLLTDRYEALCQTLASASPRAVVLSLGRIADKVDPALFVDMTSLQDPSDKQIHTRQVITGKGILNRGIAEKEENVNRYTLWDFATSYSAKGFIGSGGIGTITTTYSAEMRKLTGEHTRVLRATVPLREEAGADGILLRNFAGSVDLSGVDSLSFAFRLSGVGETSTVVFFLGAEDWRMEYPVEESLDGEILTVTCPLTDLADTMRCEYIGVMLSGNTEITLDLLSVWVDSTELDGEALTARFTQTPSTTTAGRYDTEIVYILLLVLVATVTITVLLIRREREEEEEGVHHV